MTDPKKQPDSGAVSNCSTARAQLPGGQPPARRGPFDGFDRTKYAREISGTRWRKRLAVVAWLSVAALFSLLIGAWATKAIGQAAYDAVHIQTCIETGC